MTADSVAAAFSFSARAAVGLAAPATAATAADTAAVLTKDRRVMFSLPISSSFSSFGVLSLESLEVPLGRRHLTSFSDVHVTRLGWHKEFPKMPG